MGVGRPWWSGAAARASGLHHDRIDHLVVPGLLLVVPEHPEVTEVDDLRRDEDGEQRAAECPAESDRLAGGLADHLDAHDPAPPVLPGLAERPDVDERHDEVTQ